MAADVAERRQTPASWRALGREITAARERRHMDQQQLARSIPVSQGFLSHIEKGKRCPKPDTLRAIARALDVEYTPLAAIVGFADAEPGGDVDMVPIEKPKVPVIRRLARYTVEQLHRLEAAAGLLTAAPDPYVENRDPLSHPEILEEMQVRDDVGEVGPNHHTGTHRAGQQ